MITITQKYATTRQVYDIGMELARRVEALEQTIQEQQQQITELRLHFEHAQETDARLAALDKMGEPFDHYVRKQRLA